MKGVTRRNSRESRSNSSKTVTRIKVRRICSVHLWCPLQKKEEATVCMLKGSGCAKMFPMISENNGDVTKALKKAFGRLLADSWLDYFGIFLYYD